MSNPIGPIVEGDNVPAQFELLSVGNKTTKRSGRLEILGLDGKPLFILHGGGHGAHKKNQPVVPAAAIPTLRAQCDMTILGTIRAGGNGTKSRLLLYRSTEKNPHPPGASGLTVDDSTLQLDGETGSIRTNNPNGKETFHLDGPNGDLWVGANGASGDILLFPPNATNNHDTNQASVWIGGTNGGISFRNTAGKQRIFIEGQSGKVLVGGAGADGFLQMFDQHGHPYLLANIQNNTAWFGVGGQEQPGFIEVRGAGYTPSIQLDGASGNINANNISLAGDLVLQNADCAEEFDIAVDAAEVEPGTVMVVDEDGRLRPSEEAFDRRVAGVISGAGDYKPGIVLDRQYSTNRRLPIALVGKVFCKVDADHGSIKVGDLLTTSPTPGHAMQAGDPLKAFGAVLGKALRPLEAGQGLIPILVALQ